MYCHVQENNRMVIGIPKMLQWDLKTTYTGSSVRLSYWDNNVSKIDPFKV